jgi:hypothetical protein
MDKFVFYNVYYATRVVSGAKQKDSTSPFLPWMSEKATKGL